jgi:HEAT repeat protein
MAALGGGDPHVRGAIVGALAKIGVPAIGALLVALKGSDRDLRDAAASALGQIEDTDAAPLLIRALHDDDWYVRMVAAEILGKVGGVGAIEPLFVAFTSEDEVQHVRKAAIDSIGRIGEPRAVEPLVVVLKDGSGWERKAATEALGRIGDGRAVAVLIGALKDYLDVRKAAAEALVAIYRSGKLGPQERALLLAQRSVITETHIDEYPYDQHEDSGIGVDFPD